MPHSESPNQAQISVKLLPSDIRQASQIGAEIILPSQTPILDLEKLSDADKHVLREAVFDNSVVVIRNQKGINPQVLPDLAKVFDSHASNLHSAGKKAVSDPKNILSSYKAGRIPRAPQVCNMVLTCISDTNKSLGWDHWIWNFQRLRRYP